MIFPEISATTLASESCTLSRRGVMSGLSLAGLGLLASSGAAQAFLSPRVDVPTKTYVPGASTNQKPTAELGHSELPSDWVRNQGALLPEYSRYLTQLKLKSISPAQVIAAHAKNKGSIWNTLPPKSWWTRMGYTLRVADRIALEMNVQEVEVISAYRSPAYNARCGGARTGSFHQANVALDLKFPVQPSKVTAAARNLRSRGLFKGGVGGYWNFTHIDTRGENTDW